MSIIPIILSILSYFAYMKYQYQAELMGKLPNYKLHTKHLEAYAVIFMIACILFGFTAFFAAVHNILWVFGALPTQETAMECLPSMTDSITNSINKQH